MEERILTVCKNSWDSSNPDQYESSNFNPALKKNPKHNKKKTPNPQNSMMNQLFAETLAFTPFQSKCATLAMLSA